MKEHNGFSAGEELLSQVLEECLEEDLSFVPPEGEIARGHRFSDNFEKKMQNIFDDSSSHIQKKKIQRHFLPSYRQAAACILVFVVCGGLFYYMIKDSVKSFTSFDEEASMEGIAEDSSEEVTAGAMDAGNGLAEEDNAAPASETESQNEQTKDYCGKTVYLAKQQEVPDMLENITTLVNCPVLDEENTILYLTIGNTGEDDFQYWSQCELEVWLVDGWYRIPLEQQEEGEWITLKAGMAVDEEVDLALYQIDCSAKYRLVTYVGEELLGAEFTFEETFIKTMEELEE